VVALEQDHLIRSGPLDEPVKHGARIGASIDVVADQNLDRTDGGTGSLLGVDSRKHLVEQVSSAMHVADRINTDALGQPWGSRLLATKK
jgi:hypothetical protein